MASLLSKRWSGEKMHLRTFLRKRMGYVCVLFLLGIEGKLL